MARVPTLKELADQRILVCVAALLAFTVGIAMQYQILFPPDLHPRRYEVGVAWARASVERPGQAGRDTGEAALVASLLTTTRVKEQIAKRAGLRPADLTTSAKGVDGPGATARGPEGDRSWPGYALGADYRAGEPALRISARGPDGRSASVLLGHGLDALAAHLRTSSVDDAVAGSRGLEIRRLGATRARTETRGPSPLLALGIALLVFILVCAAPLGVAALRRRRAGVGTARTDPEDGESTEVRPLEPNLGKAPSQFPNPKPQPIATPTLKPEPIAAEPIAASIAVVPVGPAAGAAAAAHRKQPGENPPASVLPQAVEPTAFLFDPGDVTSLLRRYSALQQLQADPWTEGAPSLAFRVARGTRREIYRVLADDAFPQRGEVLAALDLVIAGGFLEPALLRHGPRPALLPALSELHVAAYLLGRGFTIERKRESLFARRDELEIKLELHAPREWIGVSELMDEVADAIENVDVPYDFHFAVGVTEVLPGKVVGAPNGEQRDRLVALTIADLRDRLDGGARSADLQVDEAELNLRLVVELEDIEPSQGRLPTRSGLLAPPARGSYSPASVVERLVGASAATSRRRSSSAAVSVLIVDLAPTELPLELKRPGYRDAFENALYERFGGGLQGYDVIAFCESRGWDEDLRCHFVLEDADVSEVVHETLFGARLASATA